MTVKVVGIVGAGLMGNGIAQSCAMAGLEVVLFDISDEALARGLKTIEGNLDRLLNKGKIDDGQRTAVLEKISTCSERRALEAADYVIEAATENLSVKLSLLSDVDAVVRPNCVIASNTSSISITKLAAALDRPERMIGLHFFNPVPVMELVEIIRGLQTDDRTYETTLALAEMIGKTPISVRNAPGFVVNRILCPMMNEAIFALQEGLATREEIDAGMRLGAGHPMGPLALTDLVGLDTFLSVMTMFYEQFNDPKYRPAPLLKEMVDAGYLGRKSSRGFYEY